jgi:hypothetical protein
LWAYTIQCVLCLVSLYNSICTLSCEPKQFNVYSVLWACTIQYVLCLVSLYNSMCTLSCEPVQFNVYSVLRVQAHVTSNHCILLVSLYLLTCIFLASTGSRLVYILWAYNAVLYFFVHWCVYIYIPCKHLFQERFVVTSIISI